jgi:hypothetical protein
MPRCISAALSVCLSFAIAGALVAQQPARDAPARPSAGTAVLSGTVVTDEVNSRPVRLATVTLYPVDPGFAGPIIPRMTTTDDTGRFAFTALPAGNYSAPRVSKPGFVPGTYGVKRTGGIGTPVTLTEGQRLTIAMKMLRGAVITGTVFDENGRPAIQMSVSATQVRVVNGQRSVAGSSFGNGGTTDDRGVYRIYGLAPGDYVVSTSPRNLSGDVRPITEAEIRWGQQQLQASGVPAATSGATPATAAGPPKPGQSVAYTPVYYPGTADPAGATAITLTAGQERSGVDFSIQLVATARIDGAVVDQNGQPPQSAQINLVSKADATALIGDPFFMLDSMMSARSAVADGKFSLAGVRPGEYTLTARAVPRGAGPAPAAGPVGGGGAPPAMTMWASTDISVNGVDQSDLTLRLEPGMLLSGRVAFDGASPPPADLSRVMIRLSTAPSPSGVTISVNVPSAPAAADGTFKLDGVTPGRYFLSASAPAAPGVTWFPRSAMVGGVDAADVPFEVRPEQDIANIAVTFTDKMAELSGTLLDASGHPTPEFSIFLFPTDRALWLQRSRRLRPPVHVGTDGKFKLTNLLAGEYYLAALADFEPNDYSMAAFLDQVAAGAMKVTIAEGEKKVQDLKISAGSGLELQHR